MQLGQEPKRQRISRDRLPETPQLFDARLRGIACDQCRVDGTDGNAGDPVGMELRVSKRFVDAGLVSSERTAALEQKSDTFEWGLSRHDRD